MADSGRAPYRVLIVGGGSAGWMAAAYLSRALGAMAELRLVESEAIGIVGVGEATIPPIRQFNAFCGIDERAFLRETQGSFKTGIEFAGWGAPGERYLHAFGQVPQELDAAVRLHHWWLHARAAGHAVPDWDALFLARAAGDGARFGIDPRPGGDLARLLPHAYHFDALAYGRHLRRVSEARGVARIEGRVAHVHRDAGSGDVTKLVLDDGRELEADLFVDCTGLASLLLGTAMDEPFEDWSRWLPADRAVVVQSERTGDAILTMTRATAHTVGWQWRIPLRDRVGNGHVYASAFSSDADAERRLLGALDGDARGDPRIIRFATGRRKRAWVGNVVGVGLAAGFLEPLESTSIHLVQTALERLVDNFPAARIEPALRDRFNRLVEAEWCQVRDFVIAHYKVTRRDDSAFWQHCRTMEVPDTLAQLLALWTERGVLDIDGGHLFQWGSWTALLLGQGLVPRRPHPLTARVDPAIIAARLDDMAGGLRRSADTLPDHAAFLHRFAG